MVRQTSPQPSTSNNDSGKIPPSLTKKKNDGEQNLKPTVTSSYGTRSRNNKYSSTPRQRATLAVVLGGRTKKGYVDDEKTKKKSNIHVGNESSGTYSATKKRAKKTEVALNKTNQKEKEDADDLSNGVKANSDWSVKCGNKNKWRLAYGDPIEIQSDGLDHSYIECFSRMYRLDGSVKLVSGFIKVTLVYEHQEEGENKDSFKKNFILKINEFQQELCDGVFKKHAILRKNNVAKFVQFMKDHPVANIGMDDSTVDNADVQVNEPPKNDVDGVDIVDDVQVDGPKKKGKKRKGTAAGGSAKKTKTHQHLHKSAFADDISAFETNYGSSDPAAKREAKQVVKAAAAVSKEKPVSKIEQLKAEIIAQNKEYNDLTRSYFITYTSAYVKNLKPPEPLYLDKTCERWRIEIIKNGIKRNPHRLRMMPPMVVLFPFTKKGFMSQHFSRQRETYSNINVKDTMTYIPLADPLTGVDVTETATGQDCQCQTLGGNHRRIAYAEIIDEELEAGLSLKAISEKYDPALIRVQVAVYALQSKTEGGRLVDLPVIEIKRLAAEDNKHPESFEKTYMDSCKNYKRILLRLCKLDSSDLSVTIPADEYKQNVEEAFKQFCLSEFPDENIDRKLKLRYEKAKMLAAMNGDRFQDLLDIEKLTNDIAINCLQLLKTKKPSSEESEAKKSHVKGFITAHYVTMPLAGLSDQGRELMIIELKRQLLHYKDTFCKERGAPATIKETAAIFQHFRNHALTESKRTKFFWAWGSYINKKSLPSLKEAYPEHTRRDKYEYLLKLDLTNPNAKLFNEKLLPPMWKEFFDRAEKWRIVRSEEAEDPVDAAIDAGVSGKDNLLRAPNNGAVVALDKLDKSLAIFLRPDCVEFRGISTFLVRDFSRNLNGQTILKSMIRMATPKFCIICLNDTSAQLKHAFELGDLRTQELYVEPFDLQKAASETTNFGTQMQYVTLLVGGPLEEERRNGKSRFLKADDLLDRKLLKHIVETVTRKQQWVLDCVSTTTADPLLLAKELLVAISSKHLHMFLDVSSIPGYGKMVDGWFDDLVGHMQTIDLAVELAIAEESNNSNVNIEDGDDSKNETTTEDVIEEITSESQEPATNNEEDNSNVNIEDGDDSKNETTTEDVIEEITSESQEPATNNEEDNSNVNNEDSDGSKNETTTEDVIEEITSPESQEPATNNAEDYDMSSKIGDSAALSPQKSNRNLLINGDIIHGPTESPESEKQGDSASRRISDGEEYNTETTVQSDESTLRKPEIEPISTTAESSGIDGKQLFERSKHGETLVETTSDSSMASFRGNGLSPQSKSITNKSIESENRNDNDQVQRTPAKDSLSASKLEENMKDDDQLQSTPAKDSSSSSKKVEIMKDNDQAQCTTPATDTDDSNYLTKDIE